MLTLEYTWIYLNIYSQSDSEHPDGSRAHTLPKPKRCPPGPQLRSVVVGNDTVGNTLSSCTLFYMNPSLILKQIESNFIGFDWHKFKKQHINNSECVTTEYHLKQTYIKHPTYKKTHTHTQNTTKKHAPYESKPTLSESPMCKISSWDLRTTSAIPARFHGYKWRSPERDTPTPTNQLIYTHYMGVSKNKATPKWMVYNGKPY